MEQMAPVLSTAQIQSKKGSCPEEFPFSQLVFIWISRSRHSWRFTPDCCMQCLKAGVWVLWEEVETGQWEDGNILNSYCSSLASHRLCWQAQDRPGLKWDKEVEWRAVLIAVFMSWAPKNFAFWSRCRLQFGLVSCTLSVEKWCRAGCWWADHTVQLESLVTHIHQHGFTRIFGHLQWGGSASTVSSTGSNPPLFDSSQNLQAFISVIKLQVMSKWVLLGSGFLFLFDFPERIWLFRPYCNLIFAWAAYWLNKLLFFLITPQHLFKLLFVLCVLQVGSIYF